MAVRTTEPAVKQLLHLDYDIIRKPPVLVHVQSAAIVIDRVASFATEEGFTLSSTTAEMMERWLACWFYTCIDPMYSQRSTLRSSGSFLRGKDEYLERAKMLDPTDSLEGFLTGLVADMTWGGKIPSEQTDYVNRS